MEKDYDHMFKFLIIGDSGVGKSCMLQRFAGDEFSVSYVTTIGVDFRIQTIMIEKERIKLQVWDTAGQERFRTMTSTSSSNNNNNNNKYCRYYRGTHGVLIAFDVTSDESFMNVKRWLFEIDQNCDSVCKVIVGNKVDCVGSRLISTEEIKTLSENTGIPYYETSAKLNFNIQEMFLGLAKMVLKVKREQVARLQSMVVDSFKLTTKSPKSRKKKHKKC